MGLKGISTRTAPIEDANKIQLLLDLPGRDGLYFTISLYTGLRMNEVAKIRWRDLIREDGTVKGENSFWVSKQKIFRSIVFHRDLKAKIAAVYAEMGAPKLEMYVFRGARGAREYNKPLSERGINRLIIQKWFDELGIETRNRSSHALRKTLAARFYKNNGLAATMALLGHRQAGQTLTYIGITEADVQKSLSEIRYV